jgi:hypothetical protein
MWVGIALPGSLLPKMSSPAGYAADISFDKAPEK